VRARVCVADPTRRGAALIPAGREWVRVCVRVLCVDVCLFVGTCVFVNICVYVYTCVCARVSVCVNVHVCIVCAAVQRGAVIQPYHPEGPLERCF
jgi:hypothetical protein